MTPVEFRHATRGAEIRWQDERERDLTQVWRGMQLYVGFLNSKQLPALQDVILRSRPRKQQGLELSDLAMLSMRYGIPLQPASPEALDALRRLRES